MKKLILYIVGAIIFIPTICQEQDNLHILLLERIDKNIKFQKTEKETLLIDNANLNNVFKKYNARNFIKSVQNAKIDELTELYEVHIIGDVESFAKELESLQQFKVKRELEIFEAESCPDPEPPVNDTWIVNKWCNNYALELIEANCAWSVDKGNSSIVVGIADTEFKTSHEDLVNQFVHLSGPVTDEYPHGTWVAGCCSPETNNNKGIAGIGYNTKMAGYRVSHIVTQSGKVYGSPYSAIMQAYNDDRPIINVSWTGTGLSVSEAQNIVNSGIVLVLAAGNDTNSTCHSSIADIPGIINVSNVNADNEHGPTNCARNQWIDFCSPGYNVSTTNDPDSLKDYIGVWGTSASAPFVAGTIGLMLSVNSNLTPARIENIIKATCDPLDDQSSYPGLVGAGRINSYCAVYHSEPLNLTGTLSGDYERYITSLNNASVNSGTVNIKAAEVTITGTFQALVGAILTIENPGSFSCP